IIMKNVIPPDHVDDLTVVEPNQPNDVPVIPDPILMDEDEDPKEEEFKEEEEPQEEEDDIEVEDTVELEDETVPASVYEVGESSTTPFFREDSDGLFPGLTRRDINSLFGQMTSLSRRLCGREMAHALIKKNGKEKDEYYGKLILDLGNEVRSSVKEGTATMKNMVRNLCNTEERAECKKLKKELKEARRFLYEERPNEAINVPVEDEKSPSFEPRGSPRDLIIMKNVIPPDHVDDLTVVEPNQPNDVPVIPEPILMDEDEDLKEEEFKEEEEPQEEEDDIEVDIKEDENEPKLTYPYKEDTVELEDETVPASVYEVGESSTTPIFREDSDGLFPGLTRRDINSLFGRMTSLSRRLCGREMAYALIKKNGKEKDEYYGKLILDLGNEVRSSVKEGTATMENMVRKLYNTEERAECKKLKKEVKEARFSNTLLRMQNERVERDLYWTRVRAHEFYRQMIRRRFLYEERPNEAIDVPVEDEKSPSFEPRGSPRDLVV
nr:hypothetical protein [Tanacetum cinerariifolium]